MRAVSLSNEESSVTLQVETDQAALSQDGASRRRKRLLWTALGVAVLMLMGVLACAPLPLAPHNPAIPPRDAANFAYSPTMPHLLLDGPEGIRSHLSGRRPDSSKGQRPFSSPVLSAAVLGRPVLERAPPAPPPPGNFDHGGGGGDGDDNPEYSLERLSETDAIKFLDDWIARTGIYLMDCQVASAELCDVELVELHRKSLEALKGLYSFCGEMHRNSMSGRKILFGLFSHNHEKLWAMAGGSITGGKVLVIRNMEINPVELNKEASVASLQMRQGLRRIAKENNLEQVLMPTETNEGVVVEELETNVTAKTLQYSTIAAPLANNRKTNIETATNVTAKTAQDDGPFTPSTTKKKKEEKKKKKKQKEKKQVATTTEENVTTKTQQ